MRIQKRFLAKYLHDIAVDQIAENYKEKGYSIDKEAPIGDYMADIVARKDQETLVIEVKSGKLSPKKKKAISELADYVRQQGNLKFLVAIATAPEEKKLEIAGLDILLETHLRFNMPDDLDELSTHSYIENLQDITIDEISIKNKFIFAKGSGVINLELQYGSNSDLATGHGFKSKDSFHFDFETTLLYDQNDQLQINKLNKLNIDTSDY